MDHASVIPMSDTSSPIEASDLSPTLLPDDFLSSAPARGALAFKMPSYEDLPPVELYREQLISYVEHVFEPLADSLDTPTLTPSMVNNYVKLKIIGPPRRRLYTPEHVARLLVLCAFKQFLPISAIGSLFDIQSITYPAHIAYDYVATTLNRSMQKAFNGDLLDAQEQQEGPATREKMLVESAATAFASRVALMSYLAYTGYTERGIKQTK